jgi:ATP-dependent Clp protease ATP-binding subunit ClpX
MDEVILLSQMKHLILLIKALEYKLGRGLRSLCEAILTDAMYELQVLMIKH